jgi:hypothetical protein
MAIHRRNSSERPSSLSAADRFSIPRKTPVPVAARCGGVLLRRLGGGTLTDLVPTHTPPSSRRVPRSYVRDLRPLTAGSARRNPHLSETGRRSAPSAASSGADRELAGCRGNEAAADALLAPCVEDARRDRIRRSCRRRGAEGGKAQPRGCIARRATSGVPLRGSAAGTACRCASTVRGAAARNHRGRRFDTGGRIGENREPEVGE